MSCESQSKLWNVFSLSASLDMHASQPLGLKIDFVGHVGNWRYCIRNAVTEYCSFQIYDPFPRPNGYKHLRSLNRQASTLQRLL